MFKKLREKLLWGSTLVLLLVITAVVGLVYRATILTVTQQTQVLIDLILENDGELPDDGAFDQQQRTFLALSEESLYEARYFSARFDQDEGQLVSLRVAALSEEEALSLARTALEKRRASGHISLSGRRVMQYGRRERADGSVLVAVVDASSRYGLGRLVVMYVAALWILVLVLFFLAMTHFSRRLVRPFVENEERQRRFITNASHELKTPLAVISANNEMMEAMGGKSRWTQSTARQIARLQSLIEDLVVLARLEEMEAPALRDVDCTRIVSEAAEAFRGVIEGSGRQYRCRISESVWARGEDRALSQLTNILLDNAAKYCDEGGAVTIELRPRARGKGAVCAVSNTYVQGRNVDTARFFERFYREDESHNSGRSGFGIGLSMAKEIAGRMKGRLRASFAEDTITFTWELPAAEGAGAANGTGTANGTGSAGGETQKTEDDAI